LLVDVENVLKGSVGTGPHTVYYFTLASGFKGGQPLGMWRIGDRRVLWLRRDQGVLRTTCDLWDGCTIGVYMVVIPPWPLSPKVPGGHGRGDPLDPRQRRDRRAPIRWSG
jgi:hypothetical protein